MTVWHPFSDEIALHVAGRISEEDATRQVVTAREILNRFAHQPGLVLADEVGMGKTFVALAVAASVAMSEKNNHRPVVVMVPRSLKQKWPQDFSVFREKCLAPARFDHVRAENADSALDLLRLLQAPEEQCCSIIFLTHGAMHRGLTDGWIKLAIIQRALHHRKNTEKLRRALKQCTGRLLRLGWVQRRCSDIWNLLLDQEPEQWLRPCGRI
jgi:hypothetical protein